ATSAGNLLVTVVPSRPGFLGERRRRSLVDVGPTPRRPVPRSSPRLPEEEREQDAGQAYTHQDPANRIDIHRAGGGVDGKGQDRADRNQKNPSSDSHRVLLGRNRTLSPLRPGENHASARAAGNGTFRSRRPRRVGSQRPCAGARSFS